MKKEKTYVVIIPAYNEAESLPGLLTELKQVLPDVPVVVISDGSKDATAAIARKNGAYVLDLPCNLGVGGAVQAGLQYACSKGYDFVVRIDGDGQHNPADIPTLLAHIEEKKVDLVVGSRFIGDKVTGVGTQWRKLGNIALAKFLSVICRNKVTDPTSGFWCVSKELANYFSHYYPTDYPEPEALSLLCRQGYTFSEVGVVVRQRQHGVSSITSIGTIYFALKVFIALVADRLRPVDRKYARKNSIKE